MVTDILAKGTELLVSGDTGAIERAFGVKLENGRIGAARGDEPQEAGGPAAARDVPGLAADIVTASDRRQRPV